MASWWYLLLAIVKRERSPCSVHQSLATRRVMLFLTARSLVSVFSCELHSTITHPSPRFLCLYKAGRSRQPISCQALWIVVYDWLCKMFHFLHFWLKTLPLALPCAIIIVWILLVLNSRSWWVGSPAHDFVRPIFTSSTKVIYWRIAEYQHDLPNQSMVPSSSALQGGLGGVQRPGIIETINSGHTGTVTLVSERHIATLLHSHNVQSAPRVSKQQGGGSVCVAKCFLLHFVTSRPLAAITRIHPQKHYFALMETTRGLLEAWSSSHQ